MKYKYLLLTLVNLCMANMTNAQFHTLKLPRPSVKVLETQELGVTDIAIDYSSPAVRGRDVWNTIVNGSDPNLAWRAGANMNTRISFSTDVTINGQSLKAGSYGIHVEVQDNVYTLLLADQDNLWGSYYLDREKHLALKVPVESEACAFSEQLDYEFVDRTDSTVVVALEWADKRIPFTVGVDLNETVVSSLRYELLGINTYRWEAWNDAAQWCLNHNTNLKEALVWADRSINGGYNGFAANKNVTNMTTKVQLLSKLNRDEEFNNALAELTSMEMSPIEANSLTGFLLRNGKADFALAALDTLLTKFEDVWYLKLNRAIANYFEGNSRQSLDELQVVKTLAPEGFQQRLGEIISEVTRGTYKIPGT